MMASAALRPSWSKSTNEVSLSGAFGSKAELAVYRVQALYLLKSTQAFRVYCVAVGTVVVVVVLGAFRAAAARCTASDLVVVVVALSA